MAVNPKTSTGWFPVARSADVGTTPMPVGADGQSFVVVRLRPGGEVSAFPPRCPHRLVALAAGSGGVGRVKHGLRPAPVPLSLLGVRRRGALRGHPLPGCRGDTAAARGPARAVGGR